MFIYMAKDILIVHTCHLWKKPIMRQSLFEHLTWTIQSIYNIHEAFSIFKTLPFPLSLIVSILVIVQFSKFQRSCFVLKQSIQLDRLLMSLCLLLVVIFFVDFLSIFSDQGHSILLSPIYFPHHPCPYLRVKHWYHVNKMYETLKEINPEAIVKKPIEKDKDFLHQPTLHISFKNSFVCFCVLSSTSLIVIFLGYFLKSNKIWVGINQCPKKNDQIYSNIPNPKL